MSAKRAAVQERAAAPVGRLARLAEPVGRLAFGIIVTLVLQASGVSEASVGRLRMFSMAINRPRTRPCPGRLLHQSRRHERGAGRKLDGGFHLARLEARGEGAARNPDLRFVVDFSDG